jgi:beta-lactamase regulating signal transducer with metallopeptidase domain
MFEFSDNLSSLVWIQIWQIGVLGLFVGCLNWFIARRSPHLAYALWLVVLSKCFVPPIGNSPVNVFGLITPSAAWQSRVNDQEPFAPALVISTNGELEQSSAANSQNEADATTTIVSVARQSATSISQATSAILSISLAQTAALVWMSGSVLLCGIAIGRSSLVSQRLRRAGIPIRDELLPLIEQLSNRIGLRRSARVLQTSTNIGPIVVGIWRPTIYVPEFLLDELPPQQLEAMLMHELAHVRRRDTWVAVLQFVAQTLWWFHPIVWWMNLQITRQRERCCDEEVIVSLRGRRADYARLLVTVLEANHRLEPLWLCPAVRPVELTRRRLEEIMKRKNMVYARSPRWCWLVAAIVAITVLPSSGRSVAQDTENAESGSRVAQNAQNKQNAQNTARSTDADAKSARAPALLSYGDGKADGKKSYGGSGHMIRFEMPEGLSNVRGLRIHGSRYGTAQAPDEDFEITFLSDDREEILDSQTAPYRLFKRGKEAWVRVLFDKEVELPEKFWVALNFNPHQTKGVYLSYDTSTKGEYSRVGLPGDEEEPKETDFGGDWMVQVMLARPAK